MKIFATITAVDSPETGWYLARTNFGTIVDGVSLTATALNIGQQVAVFEVEGVFGAFADYGTHKSILGIPEAQRAGVYASNPASCALAYIAKLAGNTREYYEIGTVTAVNDAFLTVSGKISGNIKTSGVAAADFTVGDKVLISTYPTNVVIGWWRTVPFRITSDAILVVFRPAFTANIVMSLLDRDFEHIKSVTFSPTLPGSIVAFAQTQQTTNDESYLYSAVQMGVSAGEIIESHFVRWHKTKFTVEIIEELPTPVVTGYSKTADDKFFWWSYPTPPAGTTDANYAYLSDTQLGGKYKVWYTGEGTETEFFPMQDVIYEAL